MKSLETLRKETGVFDVQKLSIALRHIAYQKLDFFVFLNTIGKPLQRELVWTPSQKREIVMSVLIGRFIPSIAIINTINDEWLVIDGKQRLSSLMAFLNNEFTIVLEGDEYYYDDLPSDYKKALRNHYIDYDVMYEQVNKPINDAEKIKWFNYLNFAGTPQDFVHLEGLKAT